MRLPPDGAASRNRNCRRPVKQNYYHVSYLSFTYSLCIIPFWRKVQRHLLAHKTVYSSNPPRMNKKTLWPQHCFAMDHSPTLGMNGTCITPLPCVLQHPLYLHPDPAHALFIPTKMSSSFRFCAAHNWTCMPTGSPRPRSGAPQLQYLRPRHRLRFHIFFTSSFWSELPKVSRLLTHVES